MMMILAFLHQVSHKFADDHSCLVAHVSTSDDSSVFQHQSLQKKVSPKSQPARDITLIPQRNSSTCLRTLTSPTPWPSISQSTPSPVCWLLVFWWTPSERCTAWRWPPKGQAGMTSPECVLWSMLNRDRDLFLWILVELDELIANWMIYE